MNAFGRLDVVVNNSGYADVAPFDQLTPERFKAVIAVRAADADRWREISTSTDYAGR